MNEMSKTLNELNQKLEKEINDAFDELVKMMNDRRNELVSLNSKAITGIPRFPRFRFPLFSADYNFASILID